MTRYQRHPEVRVADVAGEGVVLHLGSRTYFTASESGLLLLERLAAPRTFDELVAALLETYDVTAERAAATVNEFLAACREFLLVEEAS